MYTESVAKLKRAKWGLGMLIYALKGVVVVHGNESCVPKTEGWAIK
jgi:hypothetical protein